MKAKNPRAYRTYPDQQLTEATHALLRMIARTTDNAIRKIVYTPEFTQCAVIIYDYCDTVEKEGMAPLPSYASAVNALKNLEPTDTALVVARLQDDMVALHKEIVELKSKKWDVEREAAMTREALLGIIQKCEKELNRFGR